MSATGHPFRPPRAQRLVAAAMTVAFIGGLASCGGDDETIGGTTTTRVRAESTGTSPVTGRDTTTTLPTTTAGSSPTASTTASEPGQQPIVDAYIGYWDARFAANAGTPNPADPALRRYATGAQLEAVVAETQENLDAGRAFQARPSPANYRRVTVVSVNGDSAVVQECFVDDGLVIDRATGEVLNDTIATHSVRGELRKADGEWRVASTSLLQRWEGVSGCALAS